MTRRWFRLLGAVITLTVVALIGWSVATENVGVPIPAVIIGLVLLYLLRRQVREVVEDERNYKISEKASRFTIQVFALVAAISGVILIAVSTDDSTLLREVGLTLAFCACGILILYLISYTYHSRKI